MPYIKTRDPFAKMTRLLLSYGMNGVKLSIVIGCSPPTGKKKLDNPELLTLAELDALHRKAHIPIEELREAIAR